jgi:hypothetical protein
LHTLQVTDFRTGTLMLGAFQLLSREQPRLFAQGGSKSPRTLFTGLSDAARVAAQFVPRPSQLLFDTSIFAL